MSKIIKTCMACEHSGLCKFKPDPYMGSHSGGWKPTISYEEYRKLLWEFHAEYCSDYASASSSS